MTYVALRCCVMDRTTKANRKHERLGRIVEILQRDLAASIHDLALQLHVSEMTVRRDLNLLAARGTVRLVHSGAILGPGNFPDDQPRYSLAEAGASRSAEKQRIGREAASLVEAGDIIIVDSGSTTEYVARSLPGDLPVTLICFALNILVEAHRKKECRVVFAGGSLHENTLMCESPEGVQLVRRYRATKAFISATGVSDKLGVTCANTYEVETKRAALASSLTRILLVDSDKFSRVRAGYFAELRDFGMVITDTGIPPHYRQLITSLGIELRAV